MVMNLLPVFSLFLNLVIILSAKVMPIAMSSSEGYGGGYSGGVDLNKYVCPEAEPIIYSWVEKAVMDDSRMAASLLRLHFHDCFVNACHFYYYLLTLLIIYFLGEWV